MLGIYVASALLIAGFMRWLGRFGWPLIIVRQRRRCRSLFFLIFEHWFLVPLPKGPLEDWLGLYRRAGTGGSMEDIAI